MARKDKPPEGGPSKAYLVSFGDTMTALLAFFIVINSLAKEQTGANLYDGTGSFVNAVSSSGTAGNYHGSSSQKLLTKSAPSPIYALAENLDKNQEGGVGPDDEDQAGRIMDRDKENFQRFLHELDRQFSLAKKPETTGQVVFDSFEAFDAETGLLSRHALQLAAETIPLLHNPKTRIEIIVWASMPSPTMIGKSVDKSAQIKQQIEKSFFIRKTAQQRIRFTAKPWLFSDAKRPIISFVVGKIK